MKASYDMKIADAIKSSVIARRGFKGSVIADEIGLPIDKPWDKNYYADVMEIAKNDKVIIYEVKSCLADYRSDKKWHNYLQFCDLFYFVSTKEVIEVIKNEVPSHVGLYTFSVFSGKTYLECKRAARKHGSKLDSTPLKNHLNKSIMYRLAKLHSKNHKQYSLEKKDIK